MFKKAQKIVGWFGIAAMVVCFYFFRGWWPFWCLTTLACVAFLVLRFTVVEEGTAQAVKTFGKFSEIIFQWDKHWMTDDWEILREEKNREKKEKRTGWRIVGGLYLYGIWPFHQIHHYKHRWTDIRLRESGKMNLEFHEEPDFGHVLLKPAVYAIHLSGVKTAPPERIPVDLLVLITLRIVNPYRFLFIAPPTPVEDILARISAEMRSLVTSRPIDNLLLLKGASIWDLLKEAKIIEDTLQKWGMELAEKGVEIQEIGLPPEYQKAAAAEQQQRFHAKATAAQTMGAMVTMIATATQKSGQELDKRVQEVQQEFADSPKKASKKYEELIRANVDFIQRQMGLDAGAVRQYYFQGGNEATNLIALLGDVLRGGGSGITTGNAVPPGGKGKKKRKKRIEDMTDKELAALSSKEVEALLDQEEEEEEEQEEKKKEE